ncbi:hypothetical protein AB4156_40805, partial [Cupriavidus sp. 2MCAB6]|uniref:hypothetical protein n=1 Tax=Cupriavidus sp. 2MCAB6 TaxID=3232981 RepID=UPI003F911E92
MQISELAPALPALGRAPAQRWRDLLIHPLVLRLVSFAAALALWEYAGRIPLSPAFPTFLETLGGLRAIMADGTLFKAFLITLHPLVIGLTASILCGSRDHGRWNPVQGLPDHTPPARHRADRLDPVR